MKKRLLSLVLSLVLCLPGFLCFPLSASAEKEMKVSRYFGEEQSDWEILEGTTNLVLWFEDVPFDAFASDLGKGKNYKWYLSFNGLPAFRNDPISCWQQSGTAGAMRFDTANHGFVPGCHPKEEGKDRLLYDLELTVYNASDKLLYTGRVEGLCSLIETPTEAVKSAPLTPQDTGFTNCSFDGGEISTYLQIKLEDRQLSRTLYEERENYRWLIILESDEGRFQTEMPVAYYNGGKLFAFQPCLQKDRFLPKVGQEYTVALALYKGESLYGYFSGGEAVWRIDEQPIYSNTRYTVQWDTGSEIVTEEYYQGVMPAYPEGTPVKPAEKEGTFYQFEGWAEELTAVDGPKTYHARYIEKINEYTVCFQMGEKGTELSLPHGALPVYPYGLDSGPHGGYYSVFTGFDRPIVPVTGNAVYTGGFEQIKKDNVSFFSFTEGVAVEGGRTTVFLRSDTEYTDLSLMLVYDQSLFRLENVAFSGEGGTFTANTLTFSGKGGAGIVAALTFKAVGQSGRCVLDILPDVYDKGKRLPVVCNSGSLTVSSYLPGDLNGDGGVDDQDIQLLKSALETGNPENFDLYHDGVTSIKDLFYLGGYIHGLPVRLYSEKDQEEHRISYTATLGGKIIGEQEQTLSALDTGSAVVAGAESICYRFSGWSDGYGSERRSDTGLMQDTALVAYYQPVVPELVIPVLNIETEYGAGVFSNTQYISATVNITKAEEEYLAKDISAQIKGRGNSTWDYYAGIRPSYSLKLTEKNRLLGVGKGAERDFVLLTTITDKSLLRNYAALRLGKLLDGIPFASDCRFVELYLDGQYKGLYLLCEKVEVADSRINIDDKSDQKEKGYLIEMDARAGYNSFTIRNGQQPFEVKSDSTAAQRSFLSKKVSALNEALLSASESDISALCDLASLVDIYILEEFTFDRDVGFASFYFYYDQGRFYFCGPWDFDLALGNDEDFPGYDYLYSEGNRGNRWFDALSRADWFLALVNARMTQMDSAVQLVIAETELMGKAIDGAAKRTFDAYPMNRYFGVAEPAEVSALKTHGAQVSYLVDWMNCRWTWMKNHFIRKK